MAEIVINDDGGKVRFSMGNVAADLTAEEARAIGEQLQRSAYKIHYGHPPPHTQPVLKAHTRQVLINRWVLVDKSLRDQGKDPRYIANTLVDLFLAEVA